MIIIIKIIMKVLYGNTENEGPCSRKSFCSQSIDHDSQCRDKKQKFSVKSKPVMLKKTAFSFPSAHLWTNLCKKKQQLEEK